MKYTDCLAIILGALFLANVLGAMFGGLYGLTKPRYETCDTQRRVVYIAPAWYVTCWLLEERR